MTQHKEPWTLHFAIPPCAPDEVARHDKNFRRLASEYVEVKAQLAAAPAQKEREIGEARAAAATARVEKTKPPTRTQDKVSAEWDVKIAALEEDLATNAVAVEQAYGALVRAVAANLDEWKRDFIEQDKVETAGLIKDIEAVEDRLARLSDVRSAPFWLNDFDLNAALRHAQSSYPGGRILASFGNLADLAHPKMNLRHWRKGVPIYERVYHGAVHLCYADGADVEPEIYAELMEGTVR